ncbi:prepilin-type N-terminal cleavage/methylation domain-containing protein [Bacillus sp. C11]|nr:prepilin-type N-terminal cleavage/methylation domain-containing protein [Neobacillus terrae]
MKEQKGFTLVELLAVIVILGIIAAIAVPSIGNLIKNTQDKATVAEGIQIINAAKMYASEKTPDSTELTDTTLAPYLDNVKLSSAGYKVVVTKDSTSGKYTYELKLHPAVSLADKDAANTSGNGLASEQELLSYK